MATLLLFGPARTAAGIGRVTIDGATVGEVQHAARARFGEGFAAVLATAAVWVNGEPASEETSVGDSDEVAVIPPVSGG